MADPKIIEEWLSKADDDFNFADANLKEESTLERALKAKEYSQKVATAIKFLLKEKGFLGPLHPQSIEDTEQ